MTKDLLDYSEDSSLRSERRGRSDGQGQKMGPVFILHNLNAIVTIFI